MREIDKLIAIPLISSILVLISMLIPIAFQPLTTSTLYGYPSGLLLVATTPAFNMTVGIFDDVLRSNIGVATIFLNSLAFVLLLATAIKYSRLSLDKKYLEPLWLLCSVLIIAGYITSLIALGMFIQDGFLMTIIGSIFSPVAALLTLYGVFIVRKEK